MTMLITGIVLGLVAVLAWLASRSFFRVDEGTLAVVTRFGAALRDGGKLRVYEPGLRTKLPWDKVHRVPMMEACLDLAGDNAVVVMGRDGTSMKVDSSLRLTPLADQLETRLFAIERPEPHMRGMFTSLLRNEVANVEGQPGESSFAVLSRDRGRVSERIRGYCEKELGPRYGVTFQAVDLVDVMPPDDLAAALNAVVAAAADAEAALAQAEAECRKRVLAAEQGVEIAKARALGAEREIDELGLVLAELHDNGTLDRYVARRRAEVLSQSRALFLGSHS